MTSGKLQLHRWFKSSRILYIVAISFVGLFGIVAFKASGPEMRVLENKPVCASRLHQIGLYILVYCTEHDGQYPDSLHTLMLNEPIDPAAFICPSSSGTPTTAPTTQSQSDDLIAPTHLSYIYVGNGLNDKTVSPKTIVAYEPLTNHGDGMNVLLGDCHVEFFNLDRGNAIIAAAATTRPVMLPP